MICSSKKCKKKRIKKLTKFIKYNFIKRFNNYLYKYYDDIIITPDLLFLIIDYNRIQILNIIYKYLSKPILFNLKIPVIQKIFKLFTVNYTTPFLLMQLCFKGNYKMIKELNYVKNNIIIHTPLQQKQCFLLCAYKCHFQTVKLIHNYFTISLDNDSIYLLIKHYYNTNKIQLFSWFINNFKINLQNIIINDYNYENLQLNLFWHSCFTSKMNFLVIIFKHLCKNNKFNLNVYSNDIHKKYFNYLIDYCLPTNTILRQRTSFECSKWNVSNKIIQWILYNQSKKVDNTMQFWYLDLFEYFCVANNYENVKWLYKIIIKPNFNNFFINDPVVLLCINNNYYQIIQYILDNNLIKIKNNHNNLLNKIFLNCIKECNIEYLMLLIDYCNKQTNYADQCFIINNDLLYSISQKYKTNINLLKLFEIIDIYNDNKIFIDNNHILFKYFCEKKVTTILNWFKIKFPFYEYYKIIDDNNSRKTYNYIPCIDTNHLQYLLYHNKWIKIANKFNMKIKAKKNNSDCIICFDNKNNVLTQCHHEFCFKCIYDWLENNNNCPKCRKSMQLSDISIII